MKESLVKERSYRFALEAIRLYRELLSRKEFVLGRQMVRAGTSIGANIEEALAAQGRRDFVAKRCRLRPKKHESARTGFAFSATPVWLLRNL